MNMRWYLVVCDIKYLLFFFTGVDDFFGSVKTIKFTAGEREKTFPVIAKNDFVPEVCIRPLKWALSRYCQ